MHWTHYILPIVFSGFTGFITVWIIIKLLFHPVKPISFLGFRFQGILPKNQPLIAQNLGRQVSKELFTFFRLQEKLTDPENFNKLKPQIENHIDTFLRDKLKDSFPMLAMFIGDKTINQLKSAFLIELEELFPVIMKSYMTNLEKELDLEKIVAEKVAGFSLVKAETMLNKYAKKQITRLQILGAGIGFATGLIHVFINIQLYS